MLFVDKYRPRDLQELSFHPELTQRLETLVGGGGRDH